MYRAAFLEIQTCTEQVTPRDDMQLVCVQITLKKVQFYPIILLLLVTYWIFHVKFYFLKTRMEKVCRLLCVGSCNIDLIWTCTKSFPSESKEQCLILCSMCCISLCYGMYSSGCGHKGSFLGFSGLPLPLL